MPKKKTRTKAGIPGTVKKGRKDKWETHVADRLETIRAWRRKGLTEEEIAANLGIAQSTLTEHKLKHPELVDALKIGKEDADSIVEGALFKRARGYDVQELETTTKPDGHQVVKTTTKHILPDPTSMIFYLKNRRARDWNDRIAKEAEAAGEEGWVLTKGFWPQWYQRDFVFDLPSETGAFLFVFHGGIGSGKTRSGAEKFGDIMWRNRGATHIIAAPTYRMLQDATKPMFFDVIQEKGLSYAYEKTDNKVTLFGDTPVLFRSMDDEQHLRGPNVAGVWIDEGGQMKTGDAFRVLEGRCRNAEAKERCILVTTTPDGLNWLYDTIEDLRAKNLCRSYGAKTQDNRYLPKDFITLVEASYDSRYAKQELAGEFLNIFTGQAYWAFSRTDHAIKADQVPYYEGLPLLLCCDFNVAPLCWNVCQEVQGVLYVIDELHVMAAATELAATEFKTRWGKHKGGVEVYGDASGWYRATSATATDYAVLEKVLEEAPAIPAVTIHAGRSNPEVKSRVASVNGRLRDLKGHRHLFLSDACTETIRDFERVCFKSGTHELDKSDPNLTHHTDAIGYLIEQKYPIRKLRGRYA